MDRNRRMLSVANDTPELVRDVPNIAHGRSNLLGESSVSGLVEIHTERTDINVVDRPKRKRRRFNGRLGRGSHAGCLLAIVHGPKAIHSKRFFFSTRSLNSYALSRNWRDIFLCVSVGAILQRHCEGFRKCIEIASGVLGSYIDTFRTGQGNVFAIG